MYKPSKPAAFAASTLVSIAIADRLINDPGNTKLETPTHTAMFTTSTVVMDTGSIWAIDPTTEVVYEAEPPRKPGTTQR